MSVKSFFKSAITEPEQPVNPAIDTAEDVWNRRDGYWIVQNYHQKKIIIGLLVVCLALVIGLVVQSLKSSVIPYVIEVDSITGQVKNVGEIQEIKYTPKDAEIKYFLSQFIANTRGIPLDPVVYKQHWNNAYAFLTKNAAQKMNAEVSAENISQQFGKKTVQVNIISILPMGENSYQVRWNEEEFLIGSGEKNTVPMTGVFTVTNIPVRDEEMLKVNPLGIYFSDFNWTKDSTKKIEKK